MLRFLSRREAEHPYLLTASQAKEDDRWTMEHYGLSSLVLMERAALAVSERIHRVADPIGEKADVLVVAGVGNNGGDGLAVARILASENRRVQVWIVGDQTKASEEFQKQRDILQKYPVEYCDKPKKDEYTIIVDALFGVGLSREVTGVFLEAVEAMNRLSGYVIAVDVPSGIDATTGAVLGTAVCADETVTFQHLKRGLVLYPGAYFAKDVTVAPIGLEHYPCGTGLFTYTLPCTEYLPGRSPMGNKSTFGKILLAAGSLNMAGAAILAAGAAYRTGAGMVKVISCEENRIPIQTAVPEALFGTQEQLPDSLGWADVIAIGPGIGKTEAARRMLRTVIEQSDKPLLLDADALNLLSEDDTLREKLSRQAKAGRTVVMTPHPGELSRWMKRPVEELRKNLIQAARDCSYAWGFVVVAKDARTIVSEGTSQQYINLSGNDGLATAGSGDVLTGIIAALLPVQEDAFSSACLGCYLHGLAADLLAEDKGKISLMAGDLPDAVSKVFMEEKGLIYHAENREDTGILQSGLRRGRSGCRCEQPAQYEGCDR